MAEFQDLFNNDPNYYGRVDPTPPSTTTRENGSNKAVTYDAKEQAVDYQKDLSKSRDTLQNPNGTIWSAPQTQTTSPTVLTSPETSIGSEEVFHLRYLTDTPLSYFMQLYFYDYKRTAAFENASIESIGSITLPLPSNLSETISPLINGMNFGAFGGEAFSSINKILESKDIKTGIDVAKKEVTRAYQSEDLRRLVFRRAIGISPEIKGGIDTITGSTPNPHLGLVFDGVDLRSFTFSWRLSPNSREESYNIQKIIGTIKRQSLPKRSKDNFYLGYPSLVKIGLGGRLKTLQDHILFKHCLITSFNVDYAPNGSHAFFRETGLPTDYAFTISLKETSIHVRDDYNTSGVGLSTQDPAYG